MSEYNIEKLISVANKLDDKGMYREALRVDILVKMAQLDRIKPRNIAGLRPEYIPKSMSRIRHQSDRERQPEAYDYGAPGSRGRYYKPSSAGGFNLEEYRRPDIRKHDDGFYYTEPIGGFGDYNIPRSPSHDYFPSPTYGGYRTPYPEPIMRDIENNRLELNRRLGTDFGPFRPTHVPDPLPYTTYRKLSGGDLSEMAEWMDPDWRIYTDSTGYPREDQHGNIKRDPKTGKPSMETYSEHWDGWKPGQSMSGISSGVRPFNDYDKSVNLGGLPKNKGRNTHVPTPLNNILQGVDEDFKNWKNKL